MNARAATLALAVVSICGAGIGGSAACRRRGRLPARVFTCDTAARDPLCGKDRDGQPMTCFPASQLDGTDFCTQSCGDQPMTFAVDSTVCVQGGAKLAFCNPDDTATPSGPCGRSDLGCLRTDVTADEGVCLTMEPCSQDADCPNPVRSTCAATFLNELYSKIPDPTPADLYWHSDHLYCLQRDCVKGGSSCGPGQSCLPLLVTAAAHPPDICVPNCDAKDRCPPNHFCFSKLSGSGQPATSACPACSGSCASPTSTAWSASASATTSRTKALRLKLCSVPCGNDADCESFDSDQGKFVCQHGPGPAVPRPTPTAGRAATTTPTARATRGPPASSPARRPVATDQGTCSRLCPGGTGPCTPRGGFGHVCLPFTVARDGTSKPGCYPGYFGLPCTADDQLRRRAWSCTGAADTSPKFCTALCQTDADCDANRWTAGQSFC